MLDEDAPYNPLDTPNIARSMVFEVLNRQARPLTDLGQFRGGGIYLIYYHGDYPAYEPLVRANAGESRFPIYVGKAVHAGARVGLEQTDKGSSLWNRLREHAESIKAVPSLNIEDFTYRRLVTVPLYIPLGEQLLITEFQPVWNVIVAGFGNHDPGAGRRVGMRPRWDELHPGRGWAALQADRKESAPDIAADVYEYLDARLP